MLTRNIAKSGEVLNLGGVSPFGHHLGLIVNRSHSASCHIATRCASVKKKPTHKWHIWFLPTHKPNVEKTKRAKFCQRTNKIVT